MPIGYGGGIQTLNQVEKLFKLGIEKVVINTAIYTNPDLIKQASHIFGSQSIVAAVDVKKSILGGYLLYSHSGSKKERITLNQLIELTKNLGAGEIFINSIDLDGTMLGYDLELIFKASSITSVPIIASGGAGNIDDFAKAIGAGASAVAAGSLFVFQGIHRAVLISYPKYEDLENALLKLDH